MTRFLVVPVAAIAFLLIGVPYAAVAQSPRSALMPETIDTEIPDFLNRMARHLNERAEPLDDEEHHKYFGDVQHEVEPVPDVVTSHQPHWVGHVFHPPVAGLP